jgi:hypothetical protein
VGVIIEIVKAVMQFKEYKVFLKALTLILSLLVSGCSTELAYVPNPPIAQRPLSPMKVAVLAFEDKTEDFTFQGKKFPLDGTFNLAKGKDVMTGLPHLYPPLLAKLFADDLKNSRAFESVKFVFDRSELLGEDMVIEGVVEQANAYCRSQWAAGGYMSRYSLIIKLKGTTKADQKVVWTNVFTKNADFTPFVAPATTLAGGLQAVFGEARQDLLQKLGVISAPPGSTQEAPSSGKSIEEIFKELKEK